MHVPCIPKARAIRVARGFNLSKRGKNGYPLTLHLGSGNVLLFPVSANGASPIPLRARKSCIRPPGSGGKNPAQPSTPKLEMWPLP